MKLIDKKTMVPAMSLPSERDHEGNLTNAVRAQFGRAAVDVGTPDRGLNDDLTDAVDTLANLMHWLQGLGLDPTQALESASRHFRAETVAGSVEEQALCILRDAGIDARLHHSGGGIWVAEVRSAEIPGRTVWVADSEGEQNGSFFVSAFASVPPAEEIAALSGACPAAQLPARVRWALSCREADPPEPGKEGGETNGP